MEDKTTVNPSAAYDTVPPRPPKKVRRVGTFTFGLLLVAAGVLLLLRSVMPELDLRFVASLLPVALIALGLEVLIYAARPNVQLKYDGLSIFVCLLILAGVGGASIAVQLWDQYGPAAHAAEMRLGDELQQNAAETLRAVPGLGDNIFDISVVLDFNHGVSDSATATVQPGDRAELYVTVYEGRYDSPEAFAAMACQVVDACRAADLGFNRYRFDTRMYNVPDDTVTYSLDLSTAWQITADAETMAESVYQNYWYNGSSFSSYDDMQDYRQEMILQDLAEKYASEFGEYPTEQWLEEQRAALAAATPETAAAQAPQDAA